MSVILGLNIGHPDSAACLLINGKLVGAVSEERLGRRIKHDSSFPHLAIQWLLKSQGLLISDIDHVAVAKNPWANLAIKVGRALLNPTKLSGAASKFIARHKTSLNLNDMVSLSVPNDTSTPKFQIVNVEHHLAHISSSYYTSPFDKSKAISFDGSGDNVSVMMAECNGPNIKILKREFLPASLGHFYTAMCQFIGFNKFGEEYKVMGLAPYGEDEYSKELKKIITTECAASFALNSSYIDVDKAMRTASTSDLHERFPDLFTNRMGDLFRARTSPISIISQREKNIAKSTQIRFEIVAQKIIGKLLEPGDNLVMAGGCALNGVNNAGILDRFDINNFYIHPAASDDGTAVGAAFYCWHNILKQKERFHMGHAFWGPSHSEDEIQKTIAAIKMTHKNLSVIKFTSETDLINVAAKDISENKVVGWYQGASEWGPRALGNRSILANPSHPNMKEIINKKIKKRESFRPFAPSVLKEDVKIYFEQDVYSPFMMHVVKFKTKWRATFPSVTHVDFSGRIQSVCKENNRKYYNLITAVKKITGHGIVLNTSFNENEPVVDTPDQAASCFIRTDMDILYLNNTRIEKNGDN